MSNQLARETSPYLLQHADNPVDWRPWSEEALQEARDSGRPVLLSIGYSACHWCHVMAHESFEDDEVAALMNRLFVNIKVDREERPDLDKIYQLSHQVLTRRPGGWPLTVALDPHTRAPFFAGTYFPKQPRYGMPGFTDILRRLADWYEENKDSLSEQKAKLQSIFERVEPAPAGSGEISPEPLEKARRQLMQHFDAEHGGFSGAPKFPHPSSVGFLLRHGAAAQDRRPLDMALFTLRQMARGGIYDQIGGGFYRYSVDERWEIPHFEKMLYDNGPLLGLYTRASRLAGDARFRHVAAETAGWVMRDMQSPQGGYYATLDADSEGGEGRFYLWEADKVRRVVGEDDFPLVARRFGLDEEPNFEGRWHLRIAAGTEELAEAFGLEAPEVERRLESARRRLFEVRERRPHPGRDEKVLTGWNALMIEGMAAAGRLLDLPECLDSAHRSLDFIRDNLWRHGRLLASYKDGEARLPGYLDDHAFLLHALLEWLQAEWHTGDLNWACELADALLTHFQDEARGGFYFTPHDHESLLYRPRPFADESTPAGNALAASALLHLGHLLGETRYLDAAERTLRACWKALVEQPLAHTSMLQLLADYQDPPAVAILRGAPPALADWQAGLDSVYHPRVAVFAIPAGAELPGELALRSPPEGVERGEVAAYVCQGTRCSAPIHELQGLLDMLQAKPDVL